MTASLPLLRWGSRGEPVRNLQGALNLWPGSRSPALHTDGIFGSKTRAKTLEFQRGNSLVPDGLVGPHTWAALEAYLSQFLSILAPATPPSTPSAGSAGIGTRIVQSAEHALARWGWPGLTVRLSPNVQSIAAAKSSTPKASHDPRPRQGGTGLQEMFSKVGVSPARCLMISREAERKWNSTKNTAWLNNHDIPDWCGIFCYYVYATAGITIGGSAPKWRKGKGIGPDLKHFHNPVSKPDQVLVGSICLNTQINHYSIVTKNDGGTIHFIEGNTPNPNPNDAHWFATTGFLSVLRRSQGSYGNLTTGHEFYFPRND